MAINLGGFSGGNNFQPNNGNQNMNNNQNMMGSNSGMMGSNPGMMGSNKNMINNGGVINNNASPLNLRKNDILDLTKKVPGLKKVVLGAGWDVAQNGQDFDLDIAALMVGANNKVQRIPDDVIFFNNMRADGIYLEGDNRTGAGEGDDERIDIDLSQIRPDIQKIVFCVTIYDAQAKRQTFGMVDNSYVRLLDAENNEREICRFNLKQDSSTVTAVIFAELFKEGMDWRFKAIGEGKIADLNGILSLYM